MNLARTLLALAPTLFIPSLSTAQTYLQSDRAEPFVPIGSIPGITGVTPFVLVTDDPFYPPTDEGFAADIPIGFTFNYLGVDFTSIGISSNGWIAFTDQFLYSYGYNPAFGDQFDPNNMIALWWDDLANTSGSVGTLGTAPNRIRVIEYTAFGPYLAPTDSGEVQLWLYEGPSRRFEVRYGGSLILTYYASAGYEGPFGQPNGAFSPCQPNCSSTNFNQLSGRAYTVQIPQRPELSADFGTFARGASSGASALGQLVLLNEGIDTATTVQSDVYLSLNQTLDANDILIGTTTDDVPAGSTTVPISVTVPVGTPFADYFLLVDIDADDQWGEFIETDNVAAGPMFATGPEFTPTAVSTAQPGINPGDQARFDVVVAQNGVPYSGPVEIRIFASQDQILDQNDRTVATQSVTLTGGAQQTVQVAGTLPNLSPGMYFPVVQIDPNSLVGETNESNNTLVSDDTFQTGPDFAIGSIVVPPPTGAGSTINVTTNVASLSVPYTGNVTYRLYASADAMISANDVNFGNKTVTFAGQPTVPDIESVTLPATMGTGRFFLLAWVDPLSAIAESNEMNNRGATATELVVGPELGVTSADFTPTSLEVGEMLNVTGSVRSNGVAFTGSASLRVFISADDVFDPGDDPIYDGTIFIVGATTAFNVSFAVPRTSPVTGDAVVPAAYRIFAAVDAENSIPEAAENDNYALAPSTLQIIGADLRVTSVTGDPVAFVGRSYQVTTSIENNGVADARGFRRVYFLSEDAAIRVFDTQVLVTATATIASGGEQTFIDTIDMPVMTSSATLYLGVIVDLFGAVPERNTNNNIGRIPVPLSIVFPIPNLNGAIVETATAGASGEDMAVTRFLRNDGVADAGSFDYTYYLSANPAISTDDIAVGTFSSGLNEGGDDYAIDVINVPSTVAPGNYYLGLIVDPLDVVDEVDENDNSFVGPQIPIFAAAIQFVTNSLTNATIGVSYEVGVYATGGPLALSYSIHDGVLPGGLALDGASGIISGTPSAEGLFPFTLRASAGTAYADRAFSIRVVAPTVELEIATPALPTAIASRPYEATLVALGGTAPYEWSAISRLPEGLTLSTGGVLSGSPATPGSLPITFRVRDTLGASKSKDLALNVINANQSIEIVQVPLPTAIVGLPYCEPETIKLEARNGLAPYTWSLIGATPLGLTLAADGSLCGTPEQAGRFPITVRAQDQTGLFDTSLFVLEVDDGTQLAISTFSLEPATVGKPYAQSLTAIRGEGQYTWTVVEGWGQLPAGLTLASDGMLTGTPVEDGSFAFVAQVIDSQLRTDTQPLSIQVAPAAKNLPDDSGCGCTAAERGGRGEAPTSGMRNEQQSGSMASLALFALIGAALLFRRRGAGWLLAAAVAIAALGTAQVASAQFVPGTPYVRTYQSVAYEACTNTTVLATDVDDAFYPVPIPFQFKFYDDFPTSLSVGSNGAIAFPMGTAIYLTNETPGSTTVPNGFIAPMWDDLRLYAANTPTLGWIVEGAAPNRTLTLCWDNVSRYTYTGNTFHMKVRMFEGPSGRIEIDYGTSSGAAIFSGTMGMEDPLGGRPVLFNPSACTNACTEADLVALTNMRVTVVQDPGIEIVAVGVTGPEIAFLGAETEVQVEVINLNINPVGPFTVSVEAGTGPTVQNPVVVGSNVVTLNGFSSSSVIVPVVIPESFGETTVYLAATVDSAGVIPEVNETNNRTVSIDSVRLLQGAPDLSVLAVSTTATAGVDAGGSLTVYTTVRNVGGEPAPATDVAVMLSSNPVISPQDVELGRFSVALAPGQSVTSTTTLTVPAATNSGIYYLGSFADPDNALDELSESNNGRARLPALSVQGGTLAIVTPELPDGYVGESYVALLAANGGNGTYEWTIVQGTLPNGLGLVPTSGELFGRPQIEETQNIVVRVESDGESAERSFTLTINDPEEPLTVVTRALAPGVVGQEYVFPLVATGGMATAGSTLTWTATGLPEGIVLEGENLMGTPVVSGDSTIDLSVTNGTETASRQLTMTVRENANLLIVPTVLSTARFGEPYTAQLTATGGVPPINWLLELGTLPEGIELSLDGVLSGTPLTVGTFRFAVEARDSETGMLNASDVNSFELIVVDPGGFSITTASLPNAIVNTGYDVTIAAEGGLMPYEWTIEDGRLPDGLIADTNPMTGEFRIAGAPSKSGVSNLLLQVVDSQQRTAIRALSIQVLETPPVIVKPDEGGCGCSAAESRSSGWAWLGVLAAAFVLLRKKRARWLGLSVVVLFTSEASAQLMPVPGTPYQRQITDITYTPLSSPVILFDNGSQEESEADVVVPFTFRYYGQDVTGPITVGANGAIILAPGQQVYLFGSPVGDTFSPHSIIAPYWSDLENFPLLGSYTGYQIDGVAPNRTLTVEWFNVSEYFNSGVQLSFQVRFFEGRSARLEIDYGNATGTGFNTATMGMEDDASARPILFSANGCNDTCNTAAIQARSNMRVALVQDPGIELSADQIGAPPFAFLNTPSTIPVSVQNLHGTSIGPFAVEIQAGTGPNFENPVPIGDFAITLGSFQQQTIQVPVFYPQSLGENSIFLRAVIDAGGAISEVDEMNNIALATEATRMLRGRADLAVDVVTTDLKTVPANGSLSVFATITNRGGETVDNAPVGVMLSSNPVVSPQDLELDRFTVTLAPGESISSTTTVSFTGVNSGVYYLGVLSDPDRAIDELSEVNNGLTAFLPVTVSGGGLSITTTDLPTAYKGTSYTALLSAVGGNEAYSWTVIQGVLPNNLGLVQSSGEFFGRPSIAETQTFTVQVTSGQETDQATFTLVVSDPAEPLTIVTRAVPGAVIGQEYNFRMLATGGSATASLAWSAADLPAGIALSSSGVLSGSVDAVGSSTISVTVTDGTETATRELLFRAVDNANLLIYPTVLSTAHYGEPYSLTLESSGGQPPITWLLELGNLPEGIELTADGTLSGTPLEVGTFRFSVEARDSGGGGLDAKDVNSFELVVVDVAGGFSIDTETLPIAILNTGYEARITASGGLPPYEWAIEDGRLPTGLVPSIDQETSEFRISGAASETGSANLLLSVVDSQGRSDKRAFALIVNDAPVVSGGEGEDDGGCGCSATDRSRTSGVFGVLALAALFILRRRR